ncbi:hypothetical protein E2C01_053232 [Portunus trituberculatus]|uniref:Uncharacterized protein n=1 Tax=Portunus trituberculatus TaxID=210409 RepID=A0A5B7GNX8_PORTR|nr:hypothetical protein [Portunus trituberculatus]
MSSLDDGSHGAKTSAGYKGKSSNRGQTSIMSSCLGEDKSWHKHFTTFHRSLKSDCTPSEDYPSSSRRQDCTLSAQSAGPAVPLQMSPFPSPSKEEMHVASWAMLMDAIAKIRGNMVKLKTEMARHTKLLESCRQGDVAGLNAGFSGFSLDDDEDSE